MFEWEDDPSKFEIGKGDWRRRLRYRYEKLREELGAARAISRTGKGGEIRLARQALRPPPLSPLPQSTLPRRRRLPLVRRRRGGSRRASSDAQRILHKLRALTTDNQAIPAAARNLLFFFLRLSVLLSHLPPFSPSPSVAVTVSHQPSSIPTSPSLPFG